MSNKNKNVPEIRFPGFTEVWEQRKLGDVSDLLTGYPFDSKEFSKSGITLIRGMNVKRGYLDYSEEAVKYWNTSDGLEKYLLQANDVLIQMDGALIGKSYAKICKNQLPALLVQRVTRLRTDNIVANSDFLYQVIQKGFLEYIKGIKTETAVPHLSLNDIREFVVGVPDIEEQKKIGELFKTLDNTIVLHQRKCDELKIYKKGMLQKMFPQPGEIKPQVRFPGFTEDWEQRKLGDEFKRRSERNDGSFGKEHWISVAKMYFQSPDKVQSNNIDTRTYVMRKGDIAFEGHPNAEFLFGRFVANDIGDGVVSELFPIYQHIQEYDNRYWKYAIQLEHVMAPVFSRAITSSGNSSNKLNDEHFYRQCIAVPSLEEQARIGSFLYALDNLITLHQRKCDELKEYKKGLLQKMFV